METTEFMSKITHLLSQCHSNLQYCSWVVWSMSLNTWRCWLCVEYVTIMRFFVSLFAVQTIKWSYTFSRMACVCGTVNQIQSKESFITMSSRFPQISVYVSSSIHLVPLQVHGSWRPQWFWLWADIQTEKRSWRDSAPYLASRADAGACPIRFPIRWGLTTHQTSDITGTLCQIIRMLHGRGCAAIDCWPKDWTCDRNSSWKNGSRGSSFEQSMCSQGSAAAAPHLCVHNSLSVLCVWSQTTDE